MGYFTVNDKGIVGDAEAGHFWARLEGRPPRDAGGEPLRYHLTFADVSERKRAEEALVRSFHELRDQLHDVVTSPATASPPTRLAA